jgi:hypothetical protein
MEESLARPLGEFDEAKSLFRAEPFDGPMNRRAAWCLEPGLDESGSGAECTRLGVEGLSAELATP